MADYLNVTEIWHQARPMAEKALSAVIDEPAHLIVEAVLLIFVLILLCKRSYRIPKAVAPAPLTESEKDALIKDWEPAPLIDERQREETMRANLGSEEGEPMLVIHSSAGAYVSLEEGKKADYMNLVTTGYLNYQDDEEMLEEAEKSLRECGVGACGPRGFYGTVDVHLHLEAKMANFFGTEQAVLYSSGFATITSVIPAFSKSDDYLFVDSGVSFQVQTAVTLARSKTFYFDHNNMTSLEALCEKHSSVFADKIHRIFVVIEGVYFNHSDIAPLDEILELKKRYPFRIIADESHSVGVLGATGRGLTEHFGLPSSAIEILSGSTGNAVGGAGGFSVGPKEATVHQRLSSNGYVFSCSLPPFVASASIAAFDRIAEGSDVARLQTRIGDLCKSLEQHISCLQVLSNENVPIAHLRLKQSTGTRLGDEKVIQEIVDKLRTEKKILVARSRYVWSERNAPPPSLRITISQKHTAADLAKACKALEEVASAVLESHSLLSSPAKPKAQKSSKKTTSAKASKNKLVIKDEESTEEAEEEEEEMISAPLISPKSSRKSGSKKKASSDASPPIGSPKASRSKKAAAAPAPTSPKTKRSAKK